MGFLSPEANALVPVLTNAFSQIPGLQNSASSIAYQIASALGNCDQSSTNNGPTNLNGPVTVNAPITINNQDGTVGLFDLAVLQQSLPPGGTAQAQGLVNPSLLVHEFFNKISGSTATVPVNTPITVALLGASTSTPGEWFDATPTIPPANAGAALITLQGGQTLVANGTANAVTLGGTSIVINEPGLLPAGLAIQADYPFPAFEEKGIWYSIYRPPTLPGVMSGDLASGDSATMALTSTYLTGSITVRGDYVPAGKKLATGDLVVGFFIDGNGVYQVLADKNCAIAYSG